MTVYALAALGMVYTHPDGLEPGLSLFFVWSGVALFSGFAILALKRNRREMQKLIQTGRPAVAKVLRKREEILGLGFGGGNVHLYVTLRIAVDGIESPEFETEVDDAVYHRAVVGAEMNVLVDPNDLRRWILAPTPM